MGPIRRALPLLVCWLGLGCGTITFGEGEAPQGPEALPDGPVTRPDAALPGDGGVIAEDGGAGGDGGRDCVAVEPGPFPSGWPFPRTEDGYRESFFLPIAEAATPRCGQCHGPSRTRAPLIPTTASELSSFSERAMDEIWASAQPLDVGGGEEMRPLIWVHHSRGGNEIPLYDQVDPATVERLQRFIDLGAACAWLPIFEAPPESDPSCSGTLTGLADAGAGRDGSQEPDAGGEAEALVDDAAVQAQTCFCPLPELSVAHCGRE